MRCSCRGLAGASRGSAARPRSSRRGPLPSDRPFQEGTYRGVSMIWIRSRRCPFPVRPRFDTRQWPPPAFPSPSSFLHDRPGSLPGTQFDGYAAFAAIHGTTPEPTRVVVIRTSHFDALAGLHLDRVAILSLIFPLNARFCVRVCHGDNSDSLHFRVADQP